MPAAFLFYEKFYKHIFFDQVTIFELLINSKMKLPVLRFLSLNLGNNYNS